MDIVIAVKGFFARRKQWQNSANKKARYASLDPCTSPLQPLIFHSLPTHPASNLPFFGPGIRDVAVAALYAVVVVVAAAAPGPGKALQAGAFLGPTLGGLLLEVVGARTAYSSTGWMLQKVQLQSAGQGMDDPSIAESPSLGSEMSDPWQGEAEVSRGDAATRLGQRNLLHTSFPTIPKTSNRGEPNSSKYLAAEEAFLEAREVLEFRDSDSVECDGDPGTRPQPLQATLRHIEISEWVAAARNEGAQVQMSESQRLQTQRNRASTAPRYVRPASARGGRTTMPGKSALWPNERMPSSYKAPLKHVLLVSCRPDEKPWAAESKPRPSRFLRRHFARASGVGALLSKDERAEEWDGQDEDDKQEEGEAEASLACSKFVGLLKDFKEMAKSKAALFLSPLPTPNSPPRTASWRDDLVPNFRLLDRRGAFGQSRGHWSLHRTKEKGKDTADQVSSLLVEDMYHTFLDAKISVQLFFFLVLYVVLFWLYAFIYLFISKPCGLELEGHLIKAYLLSLETMLTIGYGIPDPYMKGCWQGPFVLTSQLLLNLIISALLIGVIFQGIARPQSRACTILCSDKAIIRCIDGAYYFMFRVCDLRSQHALVEPHIRCYCVEQSDIRGFETTQMRLLQPDDESQAETVCEYCGPPDRCLESFGAPSTGRREAMPAEGVAGKVRNHGGFAWSPGAALLGQAVQRRRRSPSQPAWTAREKSGHQRTEANSEVGNGDSCACPTCGETFPTAETLKRHCRYNAAQDEISQLPEKARHKELTQKELEALCHSDPTKEDIGAYLGKSFKEVVVLVEGIEPTTSATLQSRHSYLVGPPEATDTDTAWDMDFVDCIMEDSGLGVDLGRFHMLQPVSAGGPSVSAMGQRRNDAHEDEHQEGGEADAAQRPRPLLSGLEASANQRCSSGAAATPDAAPTLNWRLGEGRQATTVAPRARLSLTLGEVQ
eukprot:s190_g10.t1